MAEYLIQGTTLTNIANEIRSLGGIEGTMTPNQMVGYISQVYDNGYDVGFEDGRNEGIRALTPVIIQNDADRTTSSLYGVSSYVYDTSYFENATVGNITYDWQNDITEQVTGTNSKLTLTVENRNAYLYVTVCVNAKYTNSISGAVTNKYISVTVPPSSNNTAQQTFSKTIGTFSYAVTYLRYSIDGN
jgi:hypothetical protein